MYNIYYTYVYIYIYTIYLPYTHTYNISYNAIQNPAFRWTIFPFQCPEKMVMVRLSHRADVQLSSQSVQP